MPITDIQPRRNPKRIWAGDRVIAEGVRGIVIATYPVHIWILPDGKRKFVSFERDKVQLDYQTKTSVAN